MHSHYRYYVPLRLPPIRNTISPSLYAFFFYLLVMGRVSPVPNHTFHTYRFLYTERFFRAAFQFLHTFHGFRPYSQGSTSLCSPIRDLFLTIRQNSLNVTVCMIARSSCRGYFIHSLSTLYYYNAPSLATRLTGDYRDRTFTGKCGPASLDTRKRKRAEPRRALPMIFALVYVAIYCSLLKANTIVSSNFFIFFHSSVLKTSSPLSILLRIS